jgi:hypothetical protein
MHEEFHAILKTLNVPLLSDDEIAALAKLQKQWEHWEKREHHHAPLRIAEEQKAAFEGFLDNPSAENEQRLMVLAETNLTGTRYALLCRAFIALRARVSARAAEILRPVCERISAALEAEHARRLEVAEPILSNKRNNPIVKEVRHAIDLADSIGSRVYSALNGDGSRMSPAGLSHNLTPPKPDSKL